MNFILQIRWFKDGREVGKHMYSTSFNDGVVVLEIPSCTVEDSGTFICVATNPLGEDRTTCPVRVEGKVFLFQGRKKSTL